MYLQHWKLDRSPFRIGLDPARFYPAATHDEALARIEYLVDERHRLGVVWGGAGMGKSLLLAKAASQLQRTGSNVAVVDTLGLGTREFLWNITDALHAGPRHEDDVVRLWRRLANHVTENRLQQIATVLLVDDAHHAGPDVMTQVHRLARLDASADARLTIVLAAAPSEYLRRAQPLAELIDLRIDLEPWSEIDTVGFVQSALVDAGRLDPVFTEDALWAVHELSQGVPRQVARLAELALLAGAANDDDLIDDATIRSVGLEIERTNDLSPVG